MFDLIKHKNEIAISFHIGYHTDWKVLVVNLSLYKYSLLISIGENRV